MNSTEQDQQQNLYASFRERLINFTRGISIITIEHIQIQLSSLIQLTEMTDQLTRQSSVSCFSVFVDIRKTRNVFRLGKPL